MATHSFQLSRDSPESRLVGGITLTIEFLSLAIDRYFSTNDWVLSLAIDPFLAQMAPHSMTPT